MRILSSATLASVVLVSLLLPTAPSVAAQPQAAPLVTTADQALEAQLEAQPGGTVVGDEIHYADGSAFVAVDAGTLSVSQCTSGMFCVWSSTSYTGSFLYKTGQGVTHTLGGTVGSFYNHRAKAARLYTNTGASSTCYAAGVMKASVTSSYSSAQKVTLSATTSC